MFENAEIIHRYTRADATADGALIDADTIEAGICASAGFTVPVAFTCAAWADTVAWNEDTEEAKGTFTGQSETGRLWDVLTMARYAARQPSNTSRVAFQVLRIAPEGPSTTARLADLTLHIGPGDAGEPVITITGPHED
jgi:hypothetical protein